MLLRPSFLRILPQQLPRCSPFRSQYTNSTWRYFASRTRGKATKPTQPLEDQGHLFAGQRPGLAKFALAVAKRGNILLYEAPKHGGYRFTAYSLTAFCYTYTVWNIHEVFIDPISEPSKWLQYAAGMGCLMMFVLGNMAAFRAKGLVKTINAYRANDQTHIRLTVRSMIPFRKFDIDVLPQDIAVSRQLVISPESMAAARKAQKTGAQRIRDAPDVSFFRNPIKRISIANWRVFRTMRQIFTQEDFIRLQLKGHRGTLAMDARGFLSPEFFAIANSVKFS